MNTIIENIVLSLTLLIGIAGMAAGVAAIGAWRMENGGRKRSSSNSDNIC